MPSAARVGDVTAHGTPLSGAGSPDVLIGGMPAWRATADVHSCPLATPQPHGAGTVVVGSASVLINGRPAARVGDAIVESGPPNTIVTGEPTVIIGGGAVGTAPDWAVELYDQMRTYVDEHNAEIGDADVGSLAGQLGGETANLYVDAAEGEAEFSFRTTDGIQIREFERGTREDATVRMETDEETVDRIATDDEPVEAFRAAIGADDIRVSGIGTLNGLKWRGINIVGDIAGFFDRV